jgi:hypothetical protein
MEEARKHWLDVFESEKDPRSAYYALNVVLAIQHAIAVKYLVSENIRTTVRHISQYPMYRGENETLPEEEEVLIGKRIDHSVRREINDWGEECDSVESQFEEDLVEDRIKDAIYLYNNK